MTCQLVVQFRAEEVEGENLGEGDPKVMSFASQLLATAVKSLSYSQLSIDCDFFHWTASASLTRIIKHDNIIGDLWRAYLCPIP